MSGYLESQELVGQTVPVVGCGVYELHCFAECIQAPCERLFENRIARQPKSFHTAWSMLFLVLLSCIAVQVHAASPWIEYAPTGTATMTHYTIPDGFIAACGCTGASTQFPTAAMSQLAYGSSDAFGA